MNDIGLRSVQWLRVMPDVLSRVEDFKREAIEELALSEQTTDGLQPPTRSLAQELRDILELGNFLFT